MNRAFLYFALFSTAFIAFPVMPQEVDELEGFTQLTNQCIKECREIEERILPLTVQLQEYVMQQGNAEDRLSQAADLYKKTVDLCKLEVFEEKNTAMIKKSSPDPKRSGIREMGSIIPPECRQDLIQIEKDTASTLNQLAELSGESETIQQQIIKQQKRSEECLKSCGEIHMEGQTISQEIKRSMDQGVSPPLSIAALARYDAAAERMRKSIQMAESGTSLRERIIASSKKFSRALISYQPSLVGVPLSNKTNWNQLGFSDGGSIVREAIPYSGGVYIPTFLEGSFKKMGITKRPSTTKLAQKRDIPRLVKIVAPESAVPHMPLSLSIFDEKDCPLIGLVIETDSGQAVRSGEGGKAHFPSLSNESDMAILRVPGTSNGSASIRISRSMPLISKPDAPLLVDSSSTIVLLGTTTTLMGSGFDGISSTTEIQIGGRKLIPLAESPESLRFKVPDDLEPGSYTLTIIEKSKMKANIPILCIKLDLSVDHAELKQGEIFRGRIDLEGTEKALLVELINNSPSQISVEPYLVPVSGGKGDFEIKGLHSGPFRITIGSVDFLKKKK